MKRPVQTPQIEFAKVVQTLKALGISNASDQSFSDFLMRGLGQNPGSIPQGTHHGLKLSSFELTLDPANFVAGADKLKWLMRGYCLTEIEFKRFLCRGLSATMTTQEHAIYLNCFGNALFSDFVIEQIGCQALQLTAYNTNSLKSGKNDRVAEVGAAYYDQHVHDKGTIKIQNGIVSECGLPSGSKPSYAISCFPSESDVHIKNVSVTTLHGAPHKASGGMRNSYGAIHVSGRTGFLHYDGGSPYQSPRSVLIEDVFCHYKNPDRDIVEIKDIVGPIMFKPGSEWVTGKIALRNCKGDIDIRGQIGNARLEVDGVDVGKVTAGFQRLALKA